MTPRLQDERGFVLSLVIFAVAALSIAGTALFLVVQSENAMANSGAESTAALHLANAGMSRYMGETFGAPRDSVTYSMGGGSVAVRAEKVLALGDTADLYIVHAEAQIRDRRVRDLVSRRSVQQFARLRHRPLTPLAGIALGSTRARTESVVIDGRDQCSVEDAHAGIVTVGSGDIDGSVGGSPPVQTMSWEEMIQSLGLDWAALRDPSFPFDYEVANVWGAGWPPFGAGLVPADEFPTIRVTGDLRAWPWLSGRGLLVVTGDVQFYDGFQWDGVILAGGINSSNGRFRIDGTVVTGLNGVEDRIELRNGTIRYNSCNVLNATRGIAMFSPMPNTWWETAD